MKLDIKTFILLISLMLVAAIGSAFVTSFLFSHREPMENAALAGPMIVPELEWDSELIWNAGSYTVNLQPVGGALNYVRISVSLRANAKKTVSELEQRKVQISDRIITILRTTSKRELDTEEGISTLKRRIMDGVNELVVESGGRVLAVYFSELVTQ